LIKSVATGHGDGKQRQSHHDFYEGKALMSTIKMPHITNLAL
jgi:hypothetical protein